MTAVKRIQMMRQKPWRADNPDAVIVSRPSKWGNPFNVSDSFTREWAVANYRSHLFAGEFSYLPADVRTQLAGKDLACWCPLDQPCHADVLLEIANKDGS